MNNQHYMQNEIMQQDRQEKLKNVEQRSQWFGFEQRENIGRRAAGKIGKSLVAVGTWLEGFERTTPQERHATS